MLWWEMNMPQLNSQVGKVKTAILPMGAVEQHGPHLPLGLDAMHALALASQTAQHRACLVLPPIYYGMCRSTAQHAGTVGITGPTLRGLVRDIGGSLDAQGVRCLCLLTGHAGGTHQASLVEAGEELLAATSLEVAVVCVLDLLEKVRPHLSCPKDSHAGEVETSLALHLWPGLVTGGAPEEYPTFPPHLLVRDKRNFWPGGVWGDPGAASPEKGALILAAEVQALSAILEQLEARAAGSA